jgi:hypothetical protein
MALAPNAPAVVLSYDPAGPQFAITAAAVMPTITVTATLKNVTLDPRAPPPMYEWKATLAFTGSVCPHGTLRNTSHSDMPAQIGPSNRFVIPFIEVRGGALVVTLSVRIGTQTLQATSENLTIVGTNPTVGAIGIEAPANQAFRKLMRLESSLRQFQTAACPLFSADNQGGVGLCQITNPAPTADEIWNWKSNVAAGWRLYQDYERRARAYPASVRNSPAFRALVTAYNASRLAPATPGQPQPPAAAPARPATLPPLAITLPDYTAEQLENDTLRGFNGYAGGIHEYRVRVDANGLLVVTEDPGGRTGTAEWERVTAADRTARYDALGIAAGRRGDVDYVNDVQGRQGF